MRVRLILGDALEELGRLPAESVDAVITDPPYCSGAISEADRRAATSQGLRRDAGARRFGWFENDNMGTAGLAWMMRTLALRCVPLLREGGWFLTFCDWRMISAIEPAIESASLSHRALVVWNKGSMGLGEGFRAQHEVILAYAKGKPKVFDAGVSNVIDAARIDTDDREHPTQKPTELVGKLIRVTTPLDGVVLDPFAGSCSTGVAAASLGRGFVGIEREAKWLEVGSRRFSELGEGVEALGFEAIDARQPSLFEGPT